MDNRNLRHKRTGYLLVIAACWLVVAGWSNSCPAQRLTQSSPEVRAAIRRSVEFLTKGKTESRVGGKSLIGLALLKAGESANNPRVQAALSANRQALQKGPKLGFDVYTTGLNILFLCELDPVRYRTEIQANLGYLLSIQKPHGGWGYVKRDTGDLSMMQYGVLACWEAHRAGIRVPDEAIDRAADFLLRSQDVSGMYTYQVTPTKSYEPVKYDDVRPTTSMAGLGSVYICTDLLGINGRLEETEEDALPDAVREAEKPQRRKTPSMSTSIAPSKFRRVMERGDRWVTTDCPAPAQVGSWTNYFLYAQERYEAFRALARGTEEEEPVWFDVGARYLLGKQEANGSYFGTENLEITTAFAVLFLVRSSHKSIGGGRDFGEGTLVGGRGLPKESDQVKVRNGQVVSLTDGESAEKLFDALENIEDIDYTKTMAALAELPPGEAQVIVSEHARKLQELVGDSSPEARLAAVAALAKSGDVSHVPTLVYALTDPDRDVVIEARDALRRIARRWDGFEMPDDFTESQRQDAIKRWKAWYLAIRPDAQF